MGVTRLAPWVGLLFLAGWTAVPRPVWLALAAVALVFAFLRARPWSRVGVFGLVLALAAVPVGFLAHRQLSYIRTGWDTYWEARETRVFADLNATLEDVLNRGEAAVEALAEATETAAGQPDVATVKALRSESGLAAAAVYGPLPEGVGVATRSPPLLVWDGTHRGRVPAIVQEAVRPYVYDERPLFSYLYFTRPVPSTGGSAVVAALLRTELPEGLRADLGDLASTVTRRSGEAVRVSRPGSTSTEAAFDVISGTDTLFSVDVVRPDRAVRAGAVESTWVKRVAALVALSWLLLALSVRDDRAGATRAAVTLVGLALILPFGRVLGPGPLFETNLLLPGSVPGSLGRILILAAAVVAVSPLLGSLRPPRRTWFPLVLLALVLPLVTTLARASATTSLLAGTEPTWIAYQGALALMLTLPIAGAFTWACGGPDPARRVGLPAAFHLGGALGLAGALAVGGGVWAWWTSGLPFWFGALWAIPVAIAVPEVARWTGWRKSLLVWVLAAGMGAAAALPPAWASRLEGRMANAETRLARLTTGVDPYLEYLLASLAREATELDRESEDPVGLLYRAWVGSGLPQEGYPAWLTLYGPGDLPRGELSLGVLQDPPALPAGLLDESRRADSAEIRRFRRPDAQYVATVPLSRGNVLTVVVPPIGRSREVSSLGPLFGRLADVSADPLTLVPMMERDPSTPRPGVQWVRSVEGWRGETLIEFPRPGAPLGDREPGTETERYHAHYLVDLAAPPLLAARWALLLALDVGVLVLLWGIGRLVFLGVRFGGGAWRGLATSFRARVTLALFAFFLLSNAIFGTLAYRTISGAAERTALVLAERVATDAAGFYLEFGGNMALLARQVGANLLAYESGELLEGSSEELVQLGLYDGWIPFDVWNMLAGREEVLASRELSLGRWNYLVAYRLLPRGDILAAPVPQQAGATAVRRREVAHLLAFAVVAGALLSFLLALLVGRTLSRPIMSLQAAAERVGGGNLEVRLPADRADEFGSVFGSFNRMVRRLRRARRALVRTTRRTQAIVDDAATGVIALDPSGRVTLANPRVEALLGVDVDVGRRLRETGSPADELVRWVHLYFRDGLREAGTEFQFGDRRLRVRARRISRQGPLGGAVLSMEDVTDELRAERILAWGEMARQVAHEVKNPLTPIKLSIQHIRRAWEDRRPDFETILDRNAEAALREIDRLATIASSFSRFGAPAVSEQGPIQAVRLHIVVTEVIELYASAEGAISFEMDVPENLPPVAARAAEMKEVLVNLLENARSAIEERGTVRVEAMADPEGVILRVRDDGSGIPEEILPRVFEPHFSTRSAGTGLGLAIVKRLVESWDGAITVGSVVGSGTLVRLELRIWSNRTADPVGPGGSGSPPDPST